MADLVVEELSMRFGGITALDSLSMTVEAGQICGLIGPNGAGKTTLFNCVGRVYQPSAGSVRLGDVDLLALPAHRIAYAGVARTFQNLGLFPSLTFLENVMAGAYSSVGGGFLKSILRIGIAAQERELEARAHRLLEMLELDRHAFSLAKDQPFGTLKRLEIARALASGPRLLLLDEPAGGLTDSEVGELSELIDSLPERFGVTVLLVEHRMAMVMGISDKIVAMSYGRKLAEGSPEEIRQHPEVIASYLGGAA
ncbi:ABC transporter ATP-binding protein [Nocardioides humi]|uniref:ABC transporter ATP-binding protein n=1 Tax=Nocardioides humi TaxID=449461 RepID=A0ABN2BPN7_9ACTN|nr:ABC transporter ATP-binding protein [Nocardioides humi]